MGMSHGWSVEDGPRFETAWGGRQSFEAFGAAVAETAAVDAGAGAVDVVELCAPREKGG